MPALFEYMYTAHPDSRRLRVVQASILAQKGRFDEAYNILGSIDDQRSKIKILVIKCMHKGKISKQAIHQAESMINMPIHSDYVSTLEELSILGREDKCEYDNDDFINLINKALEQRVINRFEEHRLIVYRGQHHWKEDRFEKALEDFELAYEHYPNDPLPLLLAINLSYRMDMKDRAQHYLELVKSIPGPYTINFKDDILFFDELLKKDKRK